MDETVQLAVTAMRERRRLQHVAVNVAKLVIARSNEELQTDIRESDIISIDGMGVLWGARLLGHAAPSRVTGIDLMLRLLCRCEQEGFRPYFFGAEQAVLEAALDTLTRQHPNLQVAGWRHGYFSADEESEIVDSIQRSRADCLFIGISSPTKERLLRKYRDVLDVPFLMGVGGSLDVLAGRVRRASPWMQELGLEWLHRLMMEPRRMWRRYLVTNSIYCGLVVREISHRYLDTESLRRWCDPGPR